VLRAARSPWLAIDPHGAIGDPGYEVGLHVVQPRPGQPGHTAAGAGALGGSSSSPKGLQIPEERVLAWGFVKASCLRCGAASPPMRGSAGTRRRHAARATAAVRARAAGSARRNHSRHPGANRWCSEGSGTDSENQPDLRESRLTWVRWSRCGSNEPQRATTERATHAEREPGI
jgi:hypothetical protein